MDSGDEWRRKEETFLKELLNVYPGTQARTFNFANTENVRDAYEEHAEYCNCFEPLIFDEALCQILENKPLQEPNEVHEMPMKRP